MYGFRNVYSQEAVAEYRKRSPRRRHPSSRVFTAVYRRFRDTSSVNIQHFGLFVRALNKRLLTWLHLLFLQVQRTNMLHCTPNYSQNGVRCVVFHII
jgi:hypothetical protein